MRNPRKKKSSGWRWLERLLILAGLAGVSVWAGSIAVRTVLEDWDGWVFDRQISGNRAPLTEYLGERAGQLQTAVRAWWNGQAVVLFPDFPARAPASRKPSSNRPRLAANAVIGRLSIPRLKLSSMVREGVQEETLSIAVGHVPSTPLPGEEGNVAVAGHRDTLFLGLREIRGKDRIRFETLKGNYEYEVVSTRIVTPKDVQVLRSGRFPELTLVTCYPFDYIGPAPQRFIVKARQIPGRDSVRAIAVSNPAQPAAEPDAAPSVTPLAPAARPGRLGQFTIGANHSAQLAPGVSIGVTSIDDGLVDGWMWIMPERRTIWLRHQAVYDPVIFTHNGEPRELLITRIAGNSVSGYLTSPQ